MSTGDINEVTIAGHVERPPSMSRDEDGQDVCEFLLSHASCEHTEYGHWDLQHYAVAIYGQAAKVFVETYQPGEMIVIAGRLDSQEHSIALWVWKRFGLSRRSRPHEYARSRHRTWVSEPLASIIAHTITTSCPDRSHDDRLPV